MASIRILLQDPCRLGLAEIHDGSTDVRVSRVHGRFLHAPVNPVLRGLYSRPLIVEDFHTGKGNH